MNHIQQVGIFCALEVEAEPIISGLGLKPAPSPDPSMPMQFFTGKRKKIEVSLVTAGKDARHIVDNVGTNAAVLGTYLLLQSFRPQLVLNVGTAGGMQTSGLNIADVCIAQGTARFHDRLTSIEKYQKYARGDYPIAEASHLARILNLKLGVVSSGNGFDQDPTGMAYLIKEGANLKEMEAAAVGWVCWMKGIPFLPVKGVTDYIEFPEQAAEKFLKSLRETCNALGSATVRILDYLSENELK